MKISNCRICKSKSFKSLFSLGKLSFTGKFAKSIKQKIPKDELTLVICNKCKLVQLNKILIQNIFTPLIMATEQE